eukprot:CAMPEP_0204004974 /NCGR_PEP_ID=MMETSP0360-20130528/18745_1 /ASSEMBLY_ACC=CAM_ASM_000342 /TAXON_ID=268821 /ORGANISM="Scrippsiella Hangoei, Strain SHTV-5" /LENGTH=237 /DNA_ID=CAMNT_0050946905 /DNA_START=55 /DNA_END=766 /DNA_ORIENTATION=-
MGSPINIRRGGQPDWMSERGTQGMGGVKDSLILSRRELDQALRAGAVDEVERRLSELETAKARLASRRHRVQGMRIELPTPGEVTYREQNDESTLTSDPTDSSEDINYCHGPAAVEVAESSPSTSRSWAWWPQIASCMSSDSVAGSTMLARQAPARQASGSVYVLGVRGNCASRVEVALLGECATRVCEWRSQVAVLFLVRAMPFRSTTDFCRPSVWRPGPAFRGPLAPGPPGRYVG